MHTSPPSVRDPWMQAFLAQKVTSASNLARFVTAFTQLVAFLAEADLLSPDCPEIPWSTLVPKIRDGVVLRRVPVSRGLIQAYLADLTDKTRYERFHSLRQFFRFLVNKGVLPVDPCAGMRVRHPAPDTSRWVLDRREVEALLAGGRNPAISRWPERDEAMVVVEVLCGPRPGELCRLRVDDVDLKKGKITFRAKNHGQSGTIELNDTAAEAIIRYLPTHPGTALEMFLDDAGAPFTRVSLLRHLKRLARESGLDRSICTYGLRHTFATLLHNMGAPAPFMKYALRHGTDSMQLHYIHPSPNEAERGPQDGLIRTLVLDQIGAAAASAQGWAPAPTGRRR